MNKRWYGVAVGGGGIAILVGTLGASAESSDLANRSGLSAMAGSARAGLADLGSLIGIEEDDNPVPPGTLDDGENLLPEATLSIDEAVQAAQTAATGPVGEVDLERFRGRLVFNVDVGDRDVKVDAADGRVLAADLDD